VYDRLHPGDRRIDPGLVPDVALDQLGRHTIEVGGVPGRVVVEHADGVAGLDELADQGGADEAGSPSDENSLPRSHESRDYPGSRRAFVLV
jgi:hypothetical protein